MDDHRQAAMLGPTGNADRGTLAGTPAARGPGSGPGRSRRGPPRGDGRLRRSTRCQSSAAGLGGGIGMDSHGRRQIERVGQFEHGLARIGVNGRAQHGFHPGGPRARAITACRSASNSGWSKWAWVSKNIDNRLWCFDECRQTAGDARAVPGRFGDTFRCSQPCTYLPSGKSSRIAMFWWRTARRKART